MWPAQAKRLAEAAGGDLRSALETLQLLSAGAPAARAHAGGNGRKVRVNPRRMQETLR